jgi:hypothetical protein
LNLLLVYLPIKIKTENIFKLKERSFSALGECITKRR